MKREGTWWITFGNHVEISLTLSCWNPLDTLELRRSVTIERFHGVDVPFISVIIAFLCIKMEWYLYIN